MIPFPRSPHPKEPDIHHLIHQPLAMPAQCNRKTFSSPPKKQIPVNIQESSQMKTVHLSLCNLGKKKKNTTSASYLTTNWCQHYPSYRTSHDNLDFGSALFTCPPFAFVYPKLLTRTDYFFS
ncbi:hypothetical protein TWF225_002299 [Orbilia oligospora]|nr:hypothetical protein TWF225_002299 [Orbilia oligospora]KAF3254391.1 hypothetical protein TWF128_006189 [Orbilia oligospora]KAF3266661.1 hypothetical protein TWF217_001446 [Orbilia oligospora]